jgi:hypothetical protein
MPLDPYITCFDWERGSENRDAISIDIWEGLVLDGFALEQDTYWWVAAKNKGLVKSEELGCGMLL